MPINIPLHKKPNPSSPLTGCGPWVSHLASWSVHLWAGVGGGVTQAPTFRRSHEDKKKEVKQLFGTDPGPRKTL